MSADYYRARRAAKRQATKPDSPSRQAARPLVQFDDPQGAKPKSPTKPEPSGVARVRGRKVPAGNGTLPVCTQDEFIALADRYGQGEHWIDIQEETGIDWGTFSRRGGCEGNVDIFLRCQAENKLATLKRIGERAEKSAFDGLKSKTVRESGTDPKTGLALDKVTETEERFADPAMARLAMEVSAPEIHGRLAQANRGGMPVGPPVNIQIVVLNERPTGPNQAVTTIEADAIDAPPRLDGES